MDFNLDNLFNLPNVTVFSYSTELEFIILNLHLINEGITCPHCNNYIDTVHHYYSSQAATPKHEGAS